MDGKYDNIIGLPHHVSSKRAPMSRADRAAQFSPFAALTGYEAAIEETGRLTETSIQLDEDAKADLQKRLTLLLAHLDKQPVVQITYFVPDEWKEGGSYETVTGTVKKVDSYEQCIRMTGGQRIPFRAVTGISGDLFRQLEAGYTADEP